MRKVVEVEPQSYLKHAIHGEDRCWIETNCYVDVLVELIHGLGFEPIAALPFTFAIDFEGDQWTFFKYPHADLFTLYGLDIQELNPWNNLVEHIAVQIEMGRAVLVELDSYYLPDTAGTAYKTEHVKTTVAVNGLSIAERRMAYWHNQGYFVLEGDDFTSIFQLEGVVHERMLPPYVERVKRTMQPDALTGAALLSESLGVFRRHLRGIPETNPFETFRIRFQQDLAKLRTQPIDAFHKYSFATLRQYGACFELCETYLQWLRSQGKPGLDRAEAAFHRIANTAKAFQFQLARAVARNKELSLEPLNSMADDWQLAMDTLTQGFL